MSDKITHIQADFAGATHRFEIERDKLHFFEHLAQQPAYALFKKIAANEWTVRDLEHVLACGLMNWSAPDSQLARMSLEMMRHVPGPSVGSIFSMPAHHMALVKKTFEKNGPAIYAPLALLILEAALFGVEPEAATFSDKSVEAA